MPDDDTEARLAAHRAAIMAVAMALNEFKPGAFAGVIELLATFERFSRQQNEPDGMIEELRILRGLFEQSLPLLPDPLPETPTPPYRNDQDQP